MLGDIGLEWLNEWEAFFELQMYEQENDISLDSYD